MSKLAMARKMIGGHIVFPYQNKPKGLMKTPVFNNPVWNKRKEEIATRVSYQQGAAHDRAVERKKIAKKNYAS